ncbi:MAG: hypothetical protein ACOYVK_22015 [Bacillota bacterium]
MKKLISMITILCILSGITMVFADESSDPARKNRLLQNSQEIQSTRENKQAAADIRPLKEQIRKNNAEIRRLKIAAKEAYDNAKRNIRRLMGQKDTLNQQQLESLKEALVSLKAHDGQLKEFLGNIKDISIDLRTARETRDMQRIEAQLQRIIQEQNKRIKQLKRLVHELNRIAKI